VLRQSEGAVPLSRLDAVWSEEAQRMRSLAGLVEDGLVVRTDAGSYVLP
jgi:A/G-specific adenine glycosylase